MYAADALRAGCLTSITITVIPRRLTDRPTVEMQSPLWLRSTATAPDSSFHWIACFGGSTTTFVRFEIDSNLCDLDNGRVQRCSFECRRRQARPLIAASNFFEQTQVGFARSPSDVMLSSDEPGGRSSRFQLRLQQTQFFPCELDGIRTLTLVVHLEVVVTLLAHSSCPGSSMQRLPGVS